MKRITFFLAFLGIGGAEKVATNLIQEMVKQGVMVDLVLVNQDASYFKNTSDRSGSYLDEIPDQVRIIDLGAERAVKAILPFAEYLRQYKPYAIISHLNYINVIAILAKKVAHAEMRLVLVEHNAITAFKSHVFSYKFAKFLMRFLYPQATSIVAVSEDVARDLETYIGLKTGRVKTIYNPVVSDQLFAKASSYLDHPWFKKDCPPVFLTVGRLTEQKDFPTLIKAFSILRGQKNARLLILGEGEQRKPLEALVEVLGLSEDIHLEGFTHNPYSYMSRAAAFVSSSRWEGLPTVLIEAMACGCPVISTDCPSGPREILDSGKYGTLVPVGDEQSLASAMLQILEKSVDREWIAARAIDIASFEKSTSEYLALLDY